MALIELAPQVAEDFDRIIDHLVMHQVAHADHRVDEIIAALEVLRQNPLIGRPVTDGRRELVIGRDSHGYLALYCYESLIDMVFVLAIRSQREAGYAK